MESPHTQTSTPLQRMRTTSNTNLINNSGLDTRGAVHKNSLSRQRSISNSQADRLYQIALDQSNNPVTTGVVNPTSVSFQWLTPHPSPQPSGYPDVSLEPFPEWTVPTPPRSDSGVPPVSTVDSSEDIVTTAISASPELAFDEPINNSEMSSLGFLLPAQYGGGVLESEPTSYAMDTHYNPSMRGSHPSVTSGSSSMANTVSTSPSLYSSRMTPVSNPDPRRPGVMQASTSDPTFTTPDYRRATNPYDSPVTTGDYSVAPSQTVPAMNGMTHSPIPSPHMSGMAQYHNAMNRSPNLYDPTLYGASAPQFTSAPSSNGAPQAFASMPPQPSHSYPPPFVGSSVNEMLAKPLGSAPSIRVLNNQRPKPQCWEHGCNGRQFSTFSNLLRHQREKSGTAAKAYCPKCGAEFTRTTARNGHLAHDKCTRNGAATGPVTGSRRSSDEK